MKRLTTTIVACGLLASGLIQANAETMRLSADGGTTWTVIDDNSPQDTNPTLGLVSYTGPVGGWVISITSGIGSPLIGSPIAPTIDVSSVNSSAGSASLIVQFSKTNCIPANNQTFTAALIANTAGTIQYNSYRDTGNVLFGSTSTYPGDPASPSATASALMTFGPASGNGLAFSNGVVVPNGGVGLYSLTIETILLHLGPGFSSTDASLIVTTPPCDCRLTFNSPTSITNCAGDTIPGVLASQDCGNGPTSVPVTFAGAVTNGVCPKIITRTNTATDNCGNVHTFVQTITVNCNPDCTLKGSVLSALIGTGGLKASVADAGPGANYFWTISNGSITNQGTTNIIFVAGLDATQPVKISVTISTGAGCITTCSLSIPLTPPRIDIGKGDTATIGFWHNKNGQGLILGASNSPALGNWLATNFPCMYGSLAGKSNSVVAALFMTHFGVSGAKADAQVMSVALASYFTSSALGGSSAVSKFGFNISPGGTGAKSYNVGNLGTVIGLQNNTSYTALQLLQAADNNCPFNSTVFNALNTIFDGINTKGDI